MSYSRGGTSWWRRRSSQPPGARSGRRPRRHIPSCRWGREVSGRQTSSIQRPWLRWLRPFPFLLLSSCLLLFLQRYRAGVCSFRGRGKAGRVFERRERAGGVVLVFVFLTSKLKLMGSVEKGGYDGDTHHRRDRLEISRNQERLAVIRPKEKHILRKGNRRTTEPLIEVPDFSGCQPFLSKSL